MSESPEAPKKCPRRSENRGEVYYWPVCFQPATAFTPENFLSWMQLWYVAIFFFFFFAPPTYWDAFTSASSLMKSWNLPFHRPAAQSIKSLFEYCSNCLHQCALFWRRQMVWYLSLSYRLTALLSFQDWKVTANSMIIYNKALPHLWIIFIILPQAVPFLQISGIRGSLHNIQDKDEQWLTLCIQCHVVFFISLPII